MVYDTTERSVQEGAPIECYRFTGSFQTYRYTSYQSQVSIGGEIFEPETMERNAIQVTTQEESQTAIEISLPYQNEMVRDYAYEESPPSLRMELFRVHAIDTDDSVKLWDGSVTGFTVQGFVAKLRVPSVFDSLLSGNVPQPKYQNPCNHVFTDTRCGILQANVSQNATVVSVNSNVIRVAGLTFTDPQVRIGRIISLGGESRMITQRVGDDLTISYPFTRLDPGDSITVVRGCDHSFFTCINEYNNGPNFGGFPVVPNRNPFTGRI